MTPLFDFAQTPDAASRWRTLNDTVMGGVSESRFEATDDGAVFRGTVSLDRGGGFASVRAPESTYDLSDADSIRLQLRGDGKRYKLTLYTHPGGRVSYRAPFEAPPGGAPTAWTTVQVPFDTLTPYRRGQPMPGAPPFDPSRVRTLGFLIGDKQDGPFRLAVRRIASVTRSSASPW